MSTANRVIKNTGFLYANRSLAKIPLSRELGIIALISHYTKHFIPNILETQVFGIFNIVGGASAMLGSLNAAMADAHTTPISILTESDEFKSYDWNKYIHR